MHIGGFQKVSLLDFPGKIAAIVFTSGCPFRCGFCHNPSLVIPPFKDKISEKFVLEYLKKRMGLLEGVVITGGEPTIHKRLLDFIKAIKILGYALKLDTCGYLPETLEVILETGFVDYVAMDIKAPLSKYSQIVGISVNQDKIQKSIKLIMDAGISYEFRSTLIDEIHTEVDVIEMAKMISGAQAYYLQRFRPASQLVNPEFKQKHALEETILEELVKKCSLYVKKCEIRQ